MRLFSRTLDEVTHRFPELVEELAKLSADVIIDGGIVPVRAGRGLPFSALQKRLGRKTVSAEMIVVFCHRFGISRRLGLRCESNVRARRSKGEMDAAHRAPKARASAPRLRRGSQSAHCAATSCRARWSPVRCAAR
ncbi:MAG: hypothetical protein C4334_07180 [Pyrinomonas sp.]